MLLEFGMQMVLIIATGYAIALSPLVARFIDRLALEDHRPGPVYLTVLVGGVTSEPRQLGLGGADGRPRPRAGHPGARRSLPVPDCVRLLLERVVGDGSLELDPAAAQHTRQLSSSRPASCRPPSR